jgi:hypothetical protein
MYREIEDEEDIKKPKGSPLADLLAQARGQDPEAEAAQAEKATRMMESQKTPEGKSYRDEPGIKPDYTIEEIGSNVVAGPIAGLAKRAAGYGVYKAAEKADEEMAKENPERVAMLQSGIGTRGKNPTRVVTGAVEGVAASRLADMKGRLPSKDSTRQSWNQLPGDKRDMYKGGYDEFHAEQIKGAKVGADEAAAALANKNVAPDPTGIKPSAGLDYEDIEKKRIAALRAKQTNSSSAYAPSREVRKPSAVSGVQSREMPAPRTLGKDEVAIPKFRDVTGSVTEREKIYLRNKKADEDRILSRKK